LEEQYEAMGLEVLGFISDDFDQAGNQGQIDACTNMYGITFDQFAIGHVTDPDGSGPEEPQPVFQWILTQPNPGPAPTAEPTWNFHKWLVSREGELIAHFPREEYWGNDPASSEFQDSPVVIAIEAELAK
jgi:glutathione peroxidase